MIDVKQAIRVARDYLLELYESTNFQLDGLLLEGVEQTDDDKYWLITFGFDVEKPIRFYGNLAQDSGDTTRFTERERSLHTVWIRRADGKPEKMSPVSLP